jgi:tetratricopeptide (TPR) repeat protein
MKTRIVISLLLAAATVSQAFAASPDEAKCRDPDADGEPQMIRACTALIDAAVDPPKVRAVIYSNRGQAFESRATSGAGEMAPDMARAAADYAEALKLDPNNARTLQRHASALYYGTKNVKAAVADLSQVVKLRPSDPETYYDRAEMLVNVEGKSRQITGLDTDDALKQAIADYTMAARLDARESKYFRRMAYAYDFLKDRDHALVAITEAIRLDPSVDHYAYRGSIYVRYGKPDDAIADLTQAMRVDPAPYLPISSVPPLMRPRANG